MLFIITSLRAIFWQRPASVFERAVFYKSEAEDLAQGHACALQLLHTLTNG